MSYPGSRSDIDFYRVTRNSSFFRLMGFVGTRQATRMGFKGRGRREEPKKKKKEVRSSLMVTETISAVSAKRSDVLTEV